jgi:tetratricopeptide (TPR) repeat protein
MNNQTNKLITQKMKKLILSLALIGFTTLAFGQKKVVRAAEKNFKSGVLETALAEVEAATKDPETSGDPATYLLLAKIQTKMFGSDSTNTRETLKIGKAALVTYNETLEMAGGETSAVGKLIVAEEIPGSPENLRPYSVMTLKNIAYEKAIDRYNEDDQEMAYYFFDFVGELDGSDSSAIYNAGFIANDLGKFEEAKRNFNKLLDMPGYNKLNAYYFLIQILSSEDKNPEAAFDIVTKAKAEYPEDKMLGVTEIQLLLQLNKFDDAMKSIKEALKSDPSNPDLLLRSGYLKEQSGDLEGAMEDYKKSVEANPNFYEGNYYTGALMLETSRKILAELNNLSDAEWEKQSADYGKRASEFERNSVPYFEKALEIRPESTDIMMVLYQIHFKLKNDAEADKYDKLLIQKLGANWKEN